MKSKVLLILALATVMLFAAAAPVMASQPKNTYTFGALSLPPYDVGTTFVSAGKIEHVRDSLGISYDFGHPWGQGVSTVDAGFDLNVDPTSSDFLTGNMVMTITSTSSAGTVVLHDTAKFEGLGILVYEGPTFTVGSIAVTHGDFFFGLLDSERAVGYGSFNDGSIHVSETTQDITVLAGPLTGYGIAWGTGTYMITG